MKPHDILLILGGAIGGLAIGYMIDKPSPASPIPVTSVHHTTQHRIKQNSEDLMPPPTLPPARQAPFQPQHHDLEDKMLEKENKRLRQILEQLDIPTTFPDYVEQETYTTMLQFYQADGTFIDPFKILEFLEQAALRYGLSAATPTKSGKDEVQKQVIIEEPTSNNAHMILTYDPQMRDDFYLSFFHPEEEYKNSKWNKNKVFITANTFQHTDNGYPTGSIIIDIEIKAERLPTWGKKKLINLVIKEENGTYNVSHHNANQVNQQGVMFNVDHDDDIEELEEKIASLYTPAERAQRVHAFYDVLHSMADEKRNH